MKNFRYSDLFMSVLLAVLLLSRPFFAQTRKAEPAELRLLIEEALNNNPDLDAARKQASAVKKAISGAGLLPDPKLTLGLMNLPIDSFSFSQEPMTGKLVAITQILPLPEKLKLSRDSARHEASASNYQQQELRNFLVFEVKKTYYDIYLIDRSIETIEKNQILMKQLMGAAENKYETGSGLQQDVLRAHLEFSRLEDRLIELQRNRRTAVSRMNHWLNRDPGASINKISAEVSPPEAEFPPLAAHELEETRPLLRAWNEILEKARNEIRLARLSVWPDLMVMGSYTQRNDLMAGMEMPDFISASISISIPVFYQKKQKSLIAQREIQYESMNAKYRDILSSIENNITHFMSELDSYRKQSALYKEGILIQARQALESAREGYQVGKVDFNAVIENWRSLLQYQLQYFTALSNFYQSSAAYEQAAGQIH